MFKKAMSEASVTDKSKCYFVDDSYGAFPSPSSCPRPFVFRRRLTEVNVVGARDFGWKEVCHLLFPEDPVPPPEEGIRQLHALEELQDEYPQLFRKRT